ncbi:unnamed protein product [Angiostrongylus costaricensis]|uniref:Uncharacterized protein n=1 Tax=Angiostrongylus costaricensis TaxID=334426 RepID=A0A0R3PLK0_ANGCS|nr:unnamed protein product [Angiostrongylus costaricensis]
MAHPSWSDQCRELYPFVFNVSCFGTTISRIFVSGSLSKISLFYVRDNFLSDTARERLGSALSNSVLNLSTDLRSTFAAFLHSIQLVNSVAVVFDFRLPYLISLRERWSQEQLDNDWFKFCQSVLSLGLHLGMSPESLHFNYPHSNIIEEARFVIEGGAIPKVGVFESAFFFPCYDFIYLYLLIKRQRPFVSINNT